MIALVLAIAFGPTSSLPVVAPVNDLCANATPIECNAQTTGDIAGANDSPPTFDPVGVERENVFYLLTIPAGQWKVSVVVTGLVDASIQECGLTLAATNAANPCGGPFKELAETVYKATAGDDTLNEGEKISVTLECLLGGKYLIEVDAKNEPDAGFGAHHVEVLCWPWTIPAPAAGDSSNKNGSSQSSFTPGSPVYFWAWLTPDVFNEVRVIAATALGDQQPLPDRLPGSAQWISTDLTGAALDSDLEALHPDGDSTVYPGTTHALVWSATAPGAYTIVVDRDGDGLFDQDSDYVDPDGFVVLASPVVLNEVYVRQQIGGDQEYLELAGPPGMPLDGMMILAVEGDAAEVRGTLDLALDLGGHAIPASGYFVAGDASVVDVDLVIGASDTLEDGTQTFYLVNAGGPAGVSAIQGLVGSDVSLPAASMSSLSSLPELATVLDLVAVTDQEAPGTDLAFDGALRVGPDLGCCALPALPGGIFRGSDGAWCTASFLDADAAANLDVPRTPGAANSACTSSVADTFCDQSDGSSMLCPCANPGAPDSGCDNAQSTGGVSIVVVAQVTAANAATLRGLGFPTAAAPTAIVLRSSMLDPAAPLVFGDGLRCLRSPLVRLAATNASAGISTHAFGHSAGAGAGQFHYQIWYRNTPSTFCNPSAAFNLSNGVSLAW